MNPSFQKSKAWACFRYGHVYSGGEEMLYLYAVAIRVHMAISKVHVYSGIEELSIVCICSHHYHRKIELLKKNAASTLNFQILKNVLKYSTVSKFTLLLSMTSSTSL